MTEPMSDAVLRHYGIKGMKWGVRRSQAQLDRAAGRKTSKASLRSKSRTKRKSSAPKASSMDDQTLRKKINRLKMEKEYSTLTKNETSKGRQFAKKALTTAGTAVAVSQLTKAGNKTVDKGMAYLSSYVKNKK